MAFQLNSVCWHSFLYVIWWAIRKRNASVTVTRWLSSDLHASLSYYFLTVFSDTVLHLNCIWEFSYKDLVINPYSDFFPTSCVCASQMTTKPPCLTLYHSLVMMPKITKSIRIDLSNFTFLSCAHFEFPSSCCIWS